MTSRSCKSTFIGVFLGCFVLCIGVLHTHAANISDFVTITPHIEIEGVYDDNIFEIPEDASLPENGDEHEDLYLNLGAGVGLDITLERPYLDLGFGVDYDFVYTKYVDNTELDDIQNNVDLDLIFTTKYEEQIGRDRFKLHIKDLLSLIPIDEEEPLISGNRAIRNNFGIGVSYKLVSTGRIAFTLGYSYDRTDYIEDDDIEVETVADQFVDSSDLTQESQIHTGSADLNYLLNSRLTYVLTYQYQFADREENSGELVSANFSRQNVLSGIRAKLTSRIHSDIQAGYSFTSYEDVGDLSQEDQDSVVVEASVTANFAYQPLMTVGYRRYFVENDFGDTLLTDTIFGDVGIKIMPGLIVNLSSDYIMEDRDLAADESTQVGFGVNTEYEVLKNIVLLAGYGYRNKEFFERNFLIQGKREETTHEFSGGMEYKVSRYFLLKGMYFYTDRTSDVEAQEFSKNRFVASGKVMF